MARLRMVQRQDFIAVLAAMDGLPVTVRLLDPPLHEFLPDLVELEVRERTGGLGDDERQLLEAARRWSETNPMIGTRGVRLGYLKPGLYQMQVRALVRGGRRAARRGREPDRGDHDPVDGDRRRAGRRPRLGHGRAGAEGPTPATRRSRWAR